MLIVTDDMIIGECKKLSPGLSLTKIRLDNLSYKRLEFTIRDSIVDIQWIQNGEFVEDDIELILEKIYKEKSQV